MLNFTYRDKTGILLRNSKVINIYWVMDQTTVSYVLSKNNSEFGQIR